MSTHHHRALLPATMTLPSGKDKHGVWLRARRPTIVSSGSIKWLKDQTLEAAVDSALELDTYVFIKMTVILWVLGIDQLFMYYTRITPGAFDMLWTAGLSLYWAIYVIPWDSVPVGLSVRGGLGSKVMQEVMGEQLTREYFSLGRHPRPFSLDALRLKLIGFYLRDSPLGRTPYHISAPETAPTAAVAAAAAAIAAEAMAAVAAAEAADVAADEAGCA